MLTKAVPHYPQHLASALPHRRRIPQPAASCNQRASHNAKLLNLSASRSLPNRLSRRPATWRRLASISVCFEYANSLSLQPAKNRSCSHLHPKKLPKSCSTRRNHSHHPHTATPLNPSRLRTSIDCWPTPARPICDRLRDPSNLTLQPLCST